VLCLGLERGLKPLSNRCLVIIIKINLTTNYQLLLNCNKVHRARQEKQMQGETVAASRYINTAAAQPADDDLAESALD
jgi:hypothetical protein